MKKTKIQMQSDAEIRYVAIHYTDMFISGNHNWEEVKESDSILGQYKREFNKRNLSIPPTIQWIKFKEASGSDYGMPFTGFTNTIIKILK